MSRRVLVTGASRGIGRAIAVELAERGFDVSVGYHQQLDAAEAVLAEIQKSSRDGRTIRLDVGDREGCAQQLAADLEDNGPYWGVVCNAGITRDVARDIRSFAPGPASAALVQMSATAPHIKIPFFRVIADSSSLK